MDPRLNDAVLAARAEVDALVAGSNAAQAAAAPAHFEVARLQAERNDRIRALDEQHAAAVDQVLADYASRIRQAEQAGQAAQHRWAQQQQAEQAERVRRQQVDGQARLLARQEQLRSTVEAEARRRGLTPEQYLASLQ